MDEKQPPPSAKSVDVKAPKENDGKGNDGGKRPPKKCASKTTKIQRMYRFFNFYIDIVFQIVTYYSNLETV